MAGFVGEAVLSGFIQKLVDMVASPELWKYAREEQVDSELNEWKKILMKIYAVLHDAEDKQMTNPLVKMWLHDLRDLAYDVEDILDEFATQALRRNLIVAQPQPPTGTVQSIFSSLSTSLTLSAAWSNLSMGSKIEEITARLQDISAQKKAPGFKRCFCWETEKAAILAMLLKDDPSDDEVCVIPIVGMGGIGKTTLAQLAFNDDKVKDHFNLRAWVCVSDDFDVLRVTKTILQSLSPHTRYANNLNLLQIELREKLYRKKFLLILDDVWNENLMNGIFSYPLQELSYDDCLSLFTRQALGARNFDAYPHLKEVGEEIVRRCKGLPLAAKALGGMLRNQLNRRAWEDILTSKIWDLPEEKSHILPALKLSYHHLPSHLKRCFAYCSIFPKDYEFHKDELILLWMAEGFLQQTKGENQPEKLGCEYFDDLFSRSFFQQSTQNSSQFLMHDLINDLAQSIAGDICFNLDDELENNKQSTAVSEKARHLSFNRQRYEMMRKFEAFHKAKCLRTLVALPLTTFSTFFISSKVLDDLLKEMKCLRVLSLSGYFISEMLPNSIGGLKHLRYLNLSDSLMNRLPDSVGHLYNLQTLILRNCYRLVELPMGIGGLINLRHVDISGAVQLQEMPPQMGNLTNLQTLSDFIVGRGSRSGVKELKNLLGLQGKLSISGLHNVVDIQDARSVNLQKKQNIKELTLKWSSDFGESRNKMNETLVLEWLQPHRNLEKLTIAFYELQDMHIVTGSRPIILTQNLHIEGMSEVRTIDEDFYGGIVKSFPSLEFLKFENMPTWKDWFFPDADEQVGPFPFLRELTIRRCSKLGIQLPDCLPSLVKLDIFGCPNLKAPFSGFASLGELSLEECEGVVFRSGVGSCLETLAIGRCHWLVTLEEQMLPCKLKILKIQDCANLEELPNGLQSLTSLQELKLERCPKLVSFPEAALSPLLRSLVLQTCPSLICFPNSELPTTLKHMRVEDCENLESLPEGMMHHKSSSTVSKNTCCLEKLWIKNCSSLKFFPTGELPSTLELLCIWGCANLESISEKMSPNVTALEYLDIRGYPNLKILPECLTSLKELHIEDCGGVESFPEGGLPPNLTSLYVGLCQNLKTPISEWGLLTLTSLSELSICGVFPNMASFSDEECLLPPSLTYLFISELESLTSLALQNLVSLTELGIDCCCKLSSLELPATLGRLEITGCPIIKESCLKEKGGYWPNFSHIPCIQIDGSYIH
ncbi:putative disease resistance RPP13-like protein 1 [Vitis vinifera]|uniref:Putative disease resistance RPP13-like protein 1 n=1 Tax=Vitis vinifera TaxID=29760 RepID=A0A438FT93_VITVI|nr:putative disease resistance RPP13-like protein 1 [Vitis vinifera]